MLFEVTRTSVWGDKKPCDNVIPVKILRVETRTLGTPEEFDKRFSRKEGKWFDVGTNHRVDENGYITRDREYLPRWGIEINSLEDLMNFKEKIGHDLVITTSWLDKKTPRIEIYDDYRE